MFQDFSNESAFSLIKQGAIIIDVRTRQEFCQGHIKNAYLVPTPFPPLTQRETATLKDQLWWVLSNYTPSNRTPVVIYCRKGIRAQAAKKLVLELVYSNVVAWGGVEEEPLKSVFAQHSNLCTHDPSHN
jgi:phage shock protein E